MGALRRAAQRKGNPMIRVAGRDWVTASEIPNHWPDVQAATVRAWAHDGKVSGHRVGKHVYYDLTELTEIEHATRHSRRGHKRTRALTGADALTS